MCAEDHVFVFPRVINMDELLEEAKRLPPVKARAVAAVLGAVVANAAGNSLGFDKLLLYVTCYTAQPLHWIYNDMTMSSVISSNKDKPEFWSPSRNPYYTMPVGSQSDYGDEFLVTLRSLVESKGNCMLM